MHSSDDASRVDPPVARSYSRRSALILGGMGLGAAMAGSALFDATPSLADEAAVGAAAEPFEIVIAIYREGTLLDFAGPSDVFHRIPNTRVRFASLHGGPVSLEYGIVFGETMRLADRRYWPWRNRGSPAPPAVWRRFPVSADEKVGRRPTT